MHEVVVVYAAPIPIGHRIEVTWYQLVERGLAGQTRTDERPAQASIRDLDTGIEYDTDWVFGGGGKPRPDTPHDVETEPLEGFRVHRRLAGTVRRCRIVTLRRFPSYDVQTHLWIEPDTP